MKPIRIDRRQVALMVEVAYRFLPNPPSQLDEPPARVHRTATGKWTPTSNILNFFNLKQKGNNYTWTAL